MQSRRDFLNIFKSTKKEQLVFKPFAPFFDASLSAHCKECMDNKCIKSCPQNIITLNNKVPFLDFSQTGCTLCNECAPSCEFGVFSEQNSGAINAKFVIEELKCVAWQKTMCMSCLDACNEKAIKFSAMFYPVIENSLCTACGFCISRCPTNAITVLENR